MRLSLAARIPRYETGRMIRIQMSSARATLRTAVSFGRGAWAECSWGTAALGRKIVGTFGGHSEARFGSFRRATLVKMFEAAWNASGPSTARGDDARMLGTPFRPGTAHVVKLRPIGVERVAERPQ